MKPLEVSDLQPKATASNGGASNVLVFVLCGVVAFLLWDKLTQRGSHHQDQGDRREQIDDESDKRKDDAPSKEGAIVVVYEFSTATPDQVMFVSAMERYVKAGKITGQRSYDAQQAESNRFKEAAKVKGIEPPLIAKLVKRDANDKDGEIVKIGKWTADLAQLEEYSK